jgi:hypothetical protein
MLDPRERRRTYRLTWNDYSRCAHAPGGAFRYLLIEVAGWSADTHDAEPAMG